MQDRNRNTIPPELESLFKEAKSVKKWLTKMKQQLIGFRYIRGYFQSDIGLEADEVVRTIDLVLDRIRMNLPDLICAQCAGPRKCKCNGRGWLTACQTVRWAERRRRVQDTSEPDTSQTASSEAS